MSSDSVPPKLTSTPRHPSAAAPPRTLVIARSTSRHLPAPLTSLVGRDDEVAAACTLLLDDGVRLLTLTGPGGVGKTRLALQIAEATAATFSDGVVFVPLAPIVDPDLVLSAVAREFGLRESGSQSAADLLANHLRHRRLLLILDNVEQVVGAAPRVAALLTECSGLTVLATSRLRLHVSGEQMFLVSSLALPDTAASGGNLPLATVAESPAVQLFLERAREVAANAILAEDNAQAVANICRRLDGLPLAIELAAVRLRLLSPRELLRRLEPALPLLTDGPADAPERLRTMRNAIAWSYDLLTPAEQLLFRRLSVFVGGCTLEAVEWVDSASGALETLAALVDASLVQGHDADGETRLTMLETIREFALEQLAASDDHDAVAARHAAWYVQLAAEVRRSGALSRREGLSRLESEHPNLRAAIAWLLTRGDVTTALHLAGDLAEFWLRHGHLAEGRGWLEQALDADDCPPTAARANALVGLGMLLWPQTARPTAQSDTDPAGDKPDDFARSMQLLDEAEAVARAAGDAGALAYARLHQGYVAYLRGDFDLAEARATEGIGTVAAIPQGFGLNAVHWLLAEVALSRGEDGSAREHFTRLLELARAGGDDISLANALTGLALLAERRGDPATALSGFADATTVCDDSGDRLHAGFCLAQAAMTAAATGRSASAVRLLAAADALAVVAGMGPVRLDVRLRHRYEQALLTARAALGEASYAVHWAAGAALSFDEVIAEIHTLAAQVGGAAPADLERDLAARSTPLSAREHDVLLLLADGLRDKAIAATLGISRRTVSQHVAAILTKLGVESRTAAVTHAMREGLLGSSIPEYA